VVGLVVWLHILLGPYWHVCVVHCQEDEGTDCVGGDSDVGW